MIRAGFGDMVGKITAIADWDLAVKANGDYRCDTCVELTNRAMKVTFDSCDQLPARDPKALGDLLEGLTLTGMDSVERGVNPNHHGIQVGVATPVIARFYEELEDLLPEGVKDFCPPHEEIEALLQRGGAPYRPQQINISRELFYQSLLKGYKVRPRYSVLQFAKDKGVLETIAGKITAELYGE